MDDKALATALTQPDAYPHPADQISVIETHISRVFLAGAFAYKLRKPVRFSFVDFSTLAARRADCETELRLNRRLAPSLYLDVVPIVAGGSAGAVRVDAEGDPLEYAVRMRRFEQQDLLSAMAESDRLTTAHIDALASGIADFHRLQPCAVATDGFGTPARIAATLRECLGGLSGLAGGSWLVERVALVLRSRAAALESAFRARLASGHVRECHGDLHLGNIVLLDGTPTPFDCIEFDPGLRWIDTISDLAFPFMDLLHRDRQALAYRLLNVYLERSGDYAGLTLLPFYVAMRALVRARVRLERARQQLESDGQPMAAVHAECQALLMLALRFLTRRPGGMVLMHGLSGSGKSTVAAQLGESGAMVRVRADVERKRRHHGIEPAAGWYAGDETNRTYQRMLAICRIGAKAGFPMIADATFLARRQRDRFAAQARRLRVPLSIVDCAASLATLRARIEARAHARQDPSDADLAVLERQLRTQEPLSASEQACVIAAARLGTPTCPVPARPSGG